MKLSNVAEFNSLRCIASITERGDKASACGQMFLGILAPPRASAPTTSCRRLAPPQTIVMSANKLPVSVSRLSVCAHRRVRVGVCGCRSGVCDGPAQ